MSRGWLVVRSRRLPLSLRLDRRTPVVMLGLLAACLAVFVLSVGYGQYQIAPADVIKTLLGLETANADHKLVVFDFRLPRALAAVLVGMALAISGAIVQGVTRNPLAAPEIIGVSSGAGLAAVALIVLLPSAPAALVPPAALGGAALAFALIYLLAWSGGESPMRLVLVGVGLASILSALTTMLITFADIYVIGKALVWLTGSVYGRDWSHIRAMLPWLALFAPLALLLAPQLNVLSLGDQVARGLGSRVALQRGMLLLAGLGLAGAAVATAGPVGFVGLMAPHLSRRLVGPAHEDVIPTAALLGGLLVALADLLGRSLFAPLDIPCGVVTAMVGAPYFLFLLARSRKRASGGNG